jgi:hypothetical protein
MKPRAQKYLTLADVLRDVEKLDISEIGTNLGDRKWLGDSRRSFIGHPDAIYFLRISRSEFFNSHACLQQQSNNQYSVHHGVCLGSQS